MSRQASPPANLQSLTPPPPPVHNRGEVITYCATLVLFLADTGLLLYDLGRTITTLA